MTTIYPKIAFFKGEIANNINIVDALRSKDFHNLVSVIKKETEIDLHKSQTHTYSDNSDAEDVLLILIMDPESYSAITNEVGMKDIANFLLGK